MQLKFFHRRLPVVGDPRPVQLPDGRFKFWAFMMGATTLYTMRTRWEGEQWSSLQQRLDQFIAQDSRGGNGKNMCWVDHVEPADDSEVKNWMEGHDWIYG